MSRRGQKLVGSRSLAKRGQQEVDRKRMQPDLLDNIAPGTTRKWGGVFPSSSYTSSPASGCVIHEAKVCIMTKLPSRTCDNNVSCGGNIWKGVH